MRAAVVVSMVWALTGSAAAQPGVSQPGSPSPPGPPGMTQPSSPALAQPSDPPAGDRSEQTALALSLGATAASFGVMALATATHHPSLTGAAAATSLITPSFGHWYAGSSDFLWIGLRGAAVATMYVGVIGVVACDEGCTGTTTARTVLIAGIAGYVAATIADIATAPSAVRRHNRERHAWTFAPMANRDGGGLAVAGQF